MSFSGFAESFEASRNGFDTTRPIDRRTLADAFFERSLLQALWEAGLPFHNPTAFSDPRDPRSAAGETLLGRAMPSLKAHFREFFCTEHDLRCTRRGNCRLLVVDGNAKIWRRCCSQRYRFYDLLPGYGYVHRGCTQRPVPGFADCVDCMAGVAQSRSSRRAHSASEAEAEERRPTYEADAEESELCEEVDEEAAPAEESLGEGSETEDTAHAQLALANAEATLQMAKEEQQQAGRTIERRTDACRPDCF